MCMHSIVSWTVEDRKNVLASKKGIAMLELNVRRGSKLPLSSRIPVYFSKKFQSDNENVDGTFERVKILYKIRLGERNSSERFKVEINI